MRKSFLFCIFSIFILFSSFPSDNTPDNIKEVVIKYITDNELPIMIDEDIIIYKEI